MADTIPNLEWYDGAASGQQRSALMRMQPDRLMISHATACHYPWDNCYQSRDDYTLFIDSGGYSHLATGTGEFDSSKQEYLEYVECHEPRYWALRDYPCEPDLLEKHDRTVAEHQRRTLEDHIELLDAAEQRNTPGQPVAVLQGWTVDDYLSHFEVLKDHGALTDYIGIGSVCRRYQPKNVAQIITRLRSEIPPKFDLHAFGVKNEVLQYREVLDSLRSADSSAYAYEFSCHDLADGESFTFRDAARSWLTWRRRLREIASTRSLDGETAFSPSENGFDEAVADGSGSEYSIRDRTWSTVLNHLRTGGCPFASEDIKEKVALSAGDRSDIETTLTAMAAHGWITQAEESELWTAGPTAAAEFGL